jgi:hypothetical protein
MDARNIARVLGRRGGRARAKRLSAAERKRIASLGARARAHSLRAARRITDNLRYADAVTDLRGGAPAVARMRTFNGRIPGIYRDGE